MGGGIGETGIFKHKNVLLGQKARKYKIYNTRFRIICYYIYIKILHEHDYLIPMNLKFKFCRPR